MSKYDEERKKIQKYLTEVIGKIILILLYFVASTAVLYGCKVSASETIPTNGDYYPFSNNKEGPEPVDGEKVSNIFTTIFLDHNRSEKISFTDLKTREKNNSSWMIDLVRSFAKMKQDMTSGNEKKENMTSGNENEENMTCSKEYIWNVFGPLLSFDYKMIAGVLKYMNNLWEWVIVAGGPIIMIFVLFGLVILNLGYFSFLWFANMVLFFEYNDCQPDRKGRKCKMPPPKSSEEAATGLAKSMFSATPGGQALNMASATPAGQALNVASATVPGVPGVPTVVPTGLPTGVPTGTDAPKLPGGLSMNGGDTKDTTPDTDEVMCEVPNTWGEGGIFGLYITWQIFSRSVVFFMGFFTGITWFLQIFIIVYIFLSIVTFVSKIDVNNDGSGGSDGSFKVVMWRLFRFYKVIITLVIVYMMVKVARKDLSGTAANGAIIAAILIALFSLFSLFIRRDIPSMTPIIEKQVTTKITPIIPTDDSSQTKQTGGGGNRKGCRTIYPTKDVKQLIKNIKKVTKQLYAI